MTPRSSLVSFPERFSPLRVNAHTRSSFVIHELLEVRGDKQAGPVVASPGELVFKCVWWKTVKWIVLSSFCGEIVGG